MPRCLPAREVGITLRRKSTGKLHIAKVICPASWSRGQFLRYVRSEHPDEGVRITDWRSASEPDDVWTTRFWMVHPDAIRRAAWTYTTQGRD